MKFERSKYSGDQILGYVFDEENQSLKIELEKEFAIELSHEDGDSVLSILPTLEMSGNEEKSCIGINNIVLYIIKGSAKVLVSPLSEGEVFCELPMSHLEHKKVCAKRIKLVLGEDSEAHLCGQG